MESCRESYVRPPYLNLVPADLLWYQNLERGYAIGEFVGYVTNGISGMDVMVAGTSDKPYQIYQGEMGSYPVIVHLKASSPLGI